MNFPVLPSISLIGCTVLFFAIVINDPQTDYRYYYKAYFTFLFMHFVYYLDRQMDPAFIDQNADP